jgi:hypothetical protein
MFAKQKANVKFMKGILFVTEVNQVAGQIINMVFLNFRYSCWHLKS